MSKSNTFGRYVLEELLATGGMAEVFKARLQGAAGFEKTVAIKRILPHWSSNKAFVEMLIDEAKISVQLSHPNITAVYELGEENSSYYIAMEYVDGMDLRNLLERCESKGLKLSENLALFILSETLSALSHAHTKTDDHGHPLKVVHRDISPQNILLSFDGRVKVADFGIAHATSKSHETQTGTFKGKFAYMSPEQAEQSDLDARSDLFSAGILFYEMLTGKRLFRKETDAQTLDSVRKCALPDLPNSVSESLQVLLKKSLSKKPAERFQSADEFLDAIYKLIHKENRKFSSEGLASFLSNFKGGEKREGTQVLAPHEKKVRTPKLGRMASRAVLYTALSLAAFLYVGLQFLEDKSSLIETRPITTEKKPIRKVLGLVSIQAKPWGTVSLDGKKIGETPLIKTSLSEGMHLLEVYYEPAGRRMRKNVAISGGLHVRCLADFTKSSEKISCQ